MAESVKVIVRCRPLNERELTMKCKGVVEGYNGTVFAYGQTGCGKSFSMQGIDDPPTQRGIIPRSFQHIFESIEVAENTKYLVHVSYLEIYNEDVRDLLSNDIKQKLELKEHPDRGVYVKELSMHPVSNVEECETIMSAGWRNRSVGATLMNADSSRSHSIFSIYLEACDTGIDGGDHIRAGKLNLVDLAGSERQSKTGATGERLREATKINLSLSALGNVISALVDGKSKHIPYRDSKLTRLLQDSLGGNTKTLMVACLSPADNNYEETLSTLRYANRAKNIKNKPRINEDPKDALLREYQEEIKKLRGLLAGQLGSEGIKALLEGQSPPPRPKSIAKEAETQPSDTSNDEAEKIRKEFEEKFKELTGKYEAEQMSNAKLQEDMNKLKSQYDQQITHLTKMSAAPSHPSEQVEMQATEAGSIYGGQQKAQVAKYIGTVDNGSTTSQKKIVDEEVYVEQQKEALKRLQMLQQNMVGGEKANDEVAKERRRRRKKHVDERKLLLAKAAREDDEVIMLNVYDSIHDELKARDRVITRKDRELEAANMDIEDVSYEFERDRAEYLSIIRKQEREISFLQAIIGKIHPTLRRDCNYSNLDRVRNESSWNDDQQVWELPDLVVVKTSLPVTGSRSLARGLSSQASLVESYSNRSDSTEEDRYFSKLTNSSSEDVANKYFLPKRQVHQIVASTHPDHTKGVHKHGIHTSSSPLLSNGLANGDRISPNHGHGTSSSSSISSQMTLNGTGSNVDFMLTRRPHRLDSLDPAAVSTKSRKKKKKHSDLP